MNGTQRKFLIGVITEKVEAKIKELNNAKLVYPSASNYLFRSIMNDTLEIQPAERILAALKTKALSAQEGADWLSEQRMGYEKKRSVMLPIESLIVLPDDFKDEVERIKRHNDEIEEQIKQLRIQLNTLEIRIQLSSDKTLQKIINEVDDMGDIGLIDAKIKLLN